MRATTEYLVAAESYMQDDALAMAISATDANCPVVSHRSQRVPGGMISIVITAEYGNEAEVAVKKAEVRNTLAVNFGPTDAI